MITALPPPPPAIEQPASHQVSYGVVTGVAARGTRRLVVRAGGQTLAARPLHRRSFHVRVALPLGDHTLAVTTVDARGNRATSRVPHVYGLPRSAAPRTAPAFEEPGLARAVRRLSLGYPGVAGVYVQSLTSGAGAAWNARAAFPAASTLKLAIAVTALARLDGTPAHGSALDGLLRRMLIDSDNASANAVERWYAGSTSAGSHLVNELMRSIGLVDSEMYGGYSVESRTSGAIPRRVDRVAWTGAGKRTTAADLAGLARSLWLASGGLGPLRRAAPGLTPTDARYLLYLLAHVRDPGKLDREVRGLPGVAVLHKAGWLDDARHDNGLVFWRGGVFVASVLTYGRVSGSDALAGRIARVALDRFRG